jgi:mannose-6-phosphate isomerase
MEETSLYPMKFLPLYKNKVWGGNKIESLGFDYSPLPNCGEMWALSGVEDNESVISNGFLANNNLSEALEIYMGELLGERNYLRFGNEFPVLIKVIDANDKLSIQVHPDNKLARARGMENGKTEMWYIMQAEKGAEIVDGFNTDITKEEYRKFLKMGHLEDILHVEHPEAGDVFFIPAGRVHALGKGLLLAEIQQTSDCTYRIYDYNRPDANGKLRELHTSEALDAIDFSPLQDGKKHYTYQQDKTVPLAECPYFTTNLISLTRSIRKDFSQLDSFVVYLCTRGVAAVKALGQIVPFHAGECVLVPAVADDVELHCEDSATLLEVYIDPKDDKDEDLRHRGDMDWSARYIGNKNPDDFIDEMDDMTMNDILDEEEEEDHCDCDHDHCDCDDEHCDCHHEHPHDDADDHECHCGHHHK